MRDAAKPQHEPKPQHELTIFEVSWRAMSSSPAPPSVSPGQAFGKYVIKRVMAEGGMATVYEANHKTLGHRVAIKLLARHLLSKPDVVERFEREARAAARIESTHVVRVIDVDVAEDKRPYIVMEYLEGRDLETELRARNQLPIGDAVGYLLEACTAVSIAHRAGIIHRDLKPANIFLAQEGPRRIVKVLDFGISKVTSANEVSATSTQTMLGTPLYMSPEQVRSARDVDGRADIWSLGVVLYEALTGQLPFMSEDASGVIAAIISDPVTPVRQLRPDVPPALEAAIMKALEKDRNRRFRLVDELASALLPFAPPWFRAPKQTTIPPTLGPGLPPHLAHSLSEGMDSERTIADPNHAPDALASHAAGQIPTPMQQLHVVSASHTPDPSQPSAVTRTTAGGGNRPPIHDRSKLVMAIVIGTAIGAIAFATALIVRASMDQRPPTQGTPPTVPTTPMTTTTMTQAPTTQPTPTTPITPTATTATTTVTVTVTATATAPTTAPTTSVATPRGVGKIDVNITSGWCAVTIDGNVVGATPIANHEVTAGSHVVNCAPSDGTPKHQTVVVVAGETARVKFTP